METWDSADGAMYLMIRGGTSTHVLLHHGREYDAASIAGIAHGLSTGRTLAPEDIPGGSAGAGKALTKLGFDVRDDSPARPAQARTARATADRAATTRAKSSPAPRATRVAASDRETYTFCPKCFLALPATGECDNCA